MTLITSYYSGGVFVAYRSGATDPDLEVFLLHEKVRNSNRACFYLAIRFDWLGLKIDDSTTLFLFVCILVRSVVFLV